MRPREELVREGIINDNKNHSYVFIATFYRDQLKKFDKIGLGKLTEFGIKVTPQLIDITKKRLNQLRPMKEGKQNEQ